MLRIAGWIALMMLALTVAADQVGVFGRSGDDWQRFDRRQFRVARVVDGDTIEVDAAGKATSVRLIGVDAPELPSDHWAERARDYLRARCEGKPVILKLEQTQTRDRDGHLLAYVYFSDSDMLNHDVIRDGQAYADRRIKHTFRPQFEMAENEARKKKRGLWRDVTEEQMPQWRREWLRMLEDAR